MENSRQIYQVKEEFSELNQCQGCLSNGRRLKPLQEDTHIVFFYLLSRLNLEPSYGIKMFQDEFGHDFNEFKATDISLCWECTATLRRIQRFRTRIRNAQYLLRQSQSLVCTSLSTLSTSQQNKDSILKLEEIHNFNDNHNVSNTDKIEVEISKNIEPKEEEKIKEETTELGEITSTPPECNNSTEYSNEDFHYIDTEFDAEDFIKREFSENRKSKIFVKNYKTKVKVTVNEDIDLKNPDKYYSPTTVSEKEMDDIIERENERRSKFYKHSCKICGHRYKAYIDLKWHRNFHHAESAGPYTCLKCNTTVQTRLELNTHWNEHYTVYKCNVCGELMRSKYAIRRHINMHDKIYTCIECQVPFSWSKDFSRHYRDIHKRCKCDYCSKTFTSKRTVLNHIKRHHLPSQCKECKKTYVSYEKLLAHYRSSHPSLVRRNTDPSLAYCVECDKQYCSVDKYKKHVNAVHVNKMRRKLSVPCPECGKIFTRKYYMTNHYNLVHSGKTKHYCTICDKYFVSGFTARQHHRLVHEKVVEPKNKICDMCGRGFSTNSILIKHRRTHTGERPYQCGFCPAAFTQRTPLVTHERTQHSQLINVQ